MKASKPEDERFFKDIVLNSILENISNETGQTLKREPAKAKKISKKKIAWFSIIVVFIALLAAFLIPLTLKVTAPIEEPAKTILQTTKQEQKEMTNSHVKQPSKSLVQDKESPHLILSPKPVKSPEEPIGQTERERAKAELLKKMKN